MSREEMNVAEMRGPSMVDILVASCLISNTERWFSTFVRIVVNSSVFVSRVRTGGSSCFPCPMIDCESQVLQIAIY